MLLSINGLRKKATRFKGNLALSMQASEQVIPFSTLPPFLLRNISRQELLKVKLAGLVRENNE